MQLLLYATPKTCDWVAILLSVALGSDKSSTKGLAHISTEDNNGKRRITIIMQKRVSICL